MIIQEDEGIILWIGCVRSGKGAIRGQAVSIRETMWDGAGFAILSALSKLNLKPCDWTRHILPSASNVFSAHQLKAPIIAVALI